MSAARPWYCTVWWTRGANVGPAAVWDRFAFSDVSQDRWDPDQRFTEYSEDAPYPAHVELKYGKFPFESIITEYYWTGLTGWQVYRQTPIIPCNQFTHW